MSIANFFDKVSLGASQLLENYNREKFQDLLLYHSILVSFDENGSETSEGKSTLDLLTRLLARLYPRLQFRGPLPFKENLEQLALSINPIIDLSMCDPTAHVVVGKSKVESLIPTFYIGSSEWDCKFSPTNPVHSVDSGNAFGAGAAACMGAANLFRVVFKDQLPYSEVDPEFVLSLLDMKLEPSSTTLSMDNFDAGKFHLIGLGAVGNSFLWAFKNSVGMKGEIIGIDPEKIALSNLQRYVLATQKSVDLNKTIIASEYLAESSVSITPFDGTWEKYIEQKKSWLLERVVICVDNANDRIVAQAALPQKIFNAWTQRENLGVSRHLSFGKTPCLSCLYLSGLKKKNKSQEIADNLNMSDKELFIRRYIANNYPVDLPLLTQIKLANDLNETTELDKFLGQPLDLFYSEVVCGGLLLNLSGDQDNHTENNIEVPSAFESALAGILLAAELIKERSNYYIEPPTTTVRFNIIRSISPYIFFPESKHEDCICNDDDYLRSYDSKWNHAN